MDVENMTSPPSYSLWLEEMPFELELIGTGYQYALCLHLWANNLCMQVFLFTLLLGYALVFFCQCKIIFYVIILVISLFVLTTLWRFFSSFSSTFWNLTIHLPLLMLLVIMVLPSPISFQLMQVRYEEIMSDSAYLDRVLAEGATKAADIADATLNNVYQAMGFLRRWAELMLQEEFMLKAE